MDLGRHKSVACNSSRSVRQYEYRMLDTTPDEIRGLLCDFPGGTVVGEGEPTGFGAGSPSVHAGFGGGDGGVVERAGEKG